MPRPPLLASRAAKTTPLLIKHGADIPWAEWLTGNTSTVAAQPYDGMVFDARVTNSTNQKVFSYVNTVTTAQCTADLASIGSSKTAFGQCSRYFPRILYTDAYAQPDPWTDSHWTTIASNFANMASAAQTAQCHGLCFDPEFYHAGGYTGPNLWDWGNNTNNPADGIYGDSGSIDPTVAPAQGIDTGHNLQAYRTKMQARGKQVMDAVLGSWPTVKMLSLYGPFISTTLTASNLNPPAYNNVAFANEGMGSFVAGFVESINAAGNHATFIDGGEAYGCRTTSDFQIFNQWRNYGLPHSTQTVMSSTVAANWRATNGIGIESNDSTTGYVTVFTESQLADLITKGMQNNAYAWLYTETNYDWWGTGFPVTPIPTSYKTAVSNARAAGRL